MIEISTGEKEMITIKIGDYDILIPDNASQDGFVNVEFMSEHKTTGTLCLSECVANNLYLALREILD